MLSFTHSAVDTFVEKCRKINLDTVLRHPSFIGTFDAFIRHFLVLPSGIPGVDSPPIIVDSWDSLNVEIRLSGRRAFKGPGISLDRFDPLDNNIDPTTIGRPDLQQHLIQNQQAYMDSAAQYRTNLINKGYLSAADARVLASKNLEDANWASSLGKALNGRFYEIIVDEAQDCNPEDIKILKWLRENGLRVTLVSDLDQAIYEFRRGVPSLLKEFSETYAETNRLPFTGNFRSSPPICSLTATLRQRSAPDDSIGKYSSVTYPIQIICYRGRISDDIGRRFKVLVENIDSDIKERIILSHTASHGLKASGSASPNNVGVSKVVQMVGIVRDFWDPGASNRKKEAMLQKAERMILGLLGISCNNEHPKRVAEQHGIDRRELRRKALELIVSLPATCVDSNDGRREWLNSLHSTVDQLNLGGSGRSFFPSPKTSSWADCLIHRVSENCPCSTIHQAKGKEFMAVCVVIPPDRAPNNNTSNLFQTWENRTDDEAKRVIYVGATRAQKLLAIAIPDQFRDRLLRILDAVSVPYASV